MHVWLEFHKPVLLGKMATIVNEVTGAIALTGRVFGSIFEYFGKLIAPTVHSVKDEVAVITGGGSGIGRYPECLGGHVRVYL